MRRAHFHRFIVLHPSRIDILTLLFCDKIYNFQQHLHATVINMRLQIRIGLRGVHSMKALR